MSGIGEDFLLYCKQSNYGNGEVDYLHTGSIGFYWYCHQIVAVSDSPLYNDFQKVVV